MSNILTPFSGTAQQPGIIFLTMQELFERLDDRTDRQTEITLSYLEIYNETIRDLLVPEGSSGKQGLMLREDANQVVSVAGLSSHHPKDVGEVMNMLIVGNAARTQSPTDANATSSRSHAVLQINVAQKDRDASVSEPMTMATLSIIDLAGSERASATRNRGERLLEGANINKSLLALGGCINALCDSRKKNHIPYRNSKLTRLLKFSLGGNCKTVMIVCVSPSSVHYDETQNTLRYANRAKNIQTKAVRNVYNVDRHVKDYLKKIDEQMARINELQAQQKEYEAVAMTKFRKLEEKRQSVAKDGIARIRAAYDHSMDERRERITNLKRLRQIERRIGMISAWVGAFDQVCETREDEEPPKSLEAHRKKASGILAELESSRQHYHQRLGKSNWERAIDSALQSSIRQVQEADSGAGSDNSDITSLKREVELLKSAAEREANSAVLEQDKSGETALVQTLLQSHFEITAILGQIMQMEEQDAVQAAREMLGKIITSSIEATSQVIRPEGGLEIIEAAPPTRSGTPKKRKPINLMAPSPLKAKVRPSLINASHLHEAPLASSSPAVSSPRRTKFGAARKGVAFMRSPRKRSPVKGAKRGVRWRDDTEDGKLADFQPTPTKLDFTPEQTLTDVVPEASTDVPEVAIDAPDSSPIPAPPQPSSELRSKSSRFETGFLSKREGGSPAPRASTAGDSSFLTPHSPLSEIAGNSAPYAGRSPLSQTQTASSDTIYEDVENASSSGDDSSKIWQDDKEQARRISSAIKMKRTSSIGHSTNGIRREHRRRSPTAASAGSPPPEGLFTASQARRMVKSDKSDDWKSSVLSPRSNPITKGTASSNARRTSTLNIEGASREAPVVKNGSLRASMAGRNSNVGSKAAWR